MSGKNTPKARQNRRRQLERLGYDYEYELGLGLAPGTELPGKSYKNGGVIRVHRRGTFKGVF